jgi:hypothetical protein
MLFVNIMPKKILKTVTTKLKNTKVKNSQLDPDEIELHEEPHPIEGAEELDEILPKTKPKVNTPKIPKKDIDEFLNDLEESRNGFE